MPLDSGGGGAQVSADVAAVGPVDVLVVAVKTYDLLAAAEQIRPLLGKDTLVLPLQNGVSAPERLSSLLGPGHVLGHSTTNPQQIGELDGPVTQRVRGLCDVLQQAGFAVEPVDDIYSALWNKLVQYAGAMPVHTARLSIGQGRTSAAIRELVMEATEEAARVARACGAVVAPAAGGRSLRYLDAVEDPSFRGSFGRDLLAGRRLELEDLVAVVVDRGAEQELPTPLLRTCYLLLLPHAAGAPDATYALAS